jgi:hypothetical protein
MLLEQFIKAIRAFRNKPAMLRQAIRDAELYHKEGELSSAELTMLKRLAMGGVDG